MEFEPLAHIIVVWATAFTILGLFLAGMAWSCSLDQTARILAFEVEEEESEVVSTWIGIPVQIGGRVSDWRPVYFCGNAEVYREMIARMV